MKASGSSQGGWAAKIIWTAAITALILIALFRGQEMGPLGWSTIAAAIWAVVFFALGKAFTGLVIAIGKKIWFIFFKEAGACIIVNHVFAAIKYRDKSFWNSLFTQTSGCVVRAVNHLNDPLFSKVFTKYGEGYDQGIWKIKPEIVFEKNGRNRYSDGNYDDYYFIVVTGGGCRVLAYMLNIYYPKKNLFIAESLEFFDNDIYDQLNAIINYLIMRINNSNFNIQYLFFKIGPSDKYSVGRMDQQLHQMKIYANTVGAVVYNARNKIIDDSGYRIYCLSLRGESLNNNVTCEVCRLSVVRNAASDCSNSTCGLNVQKIARQ